MLESLRCNTCIHCHVCHAVAECTNTLYPCKDYEKNRSHGEWVEVPRYNRKGKRFLDCSVCHYGEKGEIVCEVAKVPNFCPNCGADMRRRGYEK